MNRSAPRRTSGQHRAWVSAIRTGAEGSPSAYSFRAMPDPLISVIVPARDAEGTLPRTLEALTAQAAPGPHEVIVVDDGSRDRTTAIARDAGAQLVSQPPLGPAAARNLGARRAAGRLLAFCDADVFPAPGWLQAGVEALERADIVQGKVLPDPAVPLGPFDRTIWVTALVGLWETASLFVTHELFERVGGFEEWLRPRSGKALAEDVWFGHRASWAGARAAFCGDALAYHAVFKRDWRSYVGERARLEYFPAMAARMPDLRDEFLYRRVFLNRRTARLDLALVAAAIALRTGSPLPLLLTAPYLRVARTHARRALPVDPRPEPC